MARKNDAFAATHVASMGSSDFVREWTRTQDGVLAFICSLVMNFSEAEDLLQETAVRAFANAERYDPARPFLPWVIGIARHVVLEHRRQTAQGCRVFDDEVVIGLAEAFETTSEQSESVYRALSACRERLSPRSRDVLRMRYEENLTPTEIASGFGENSGMIRALLHRIRHQLRTCIEHRLRAEGLPS